MKLAELTNKIIHENYLISEDQALELVKEPLEVLRRSAKAITSAFFKDKVELCCISNSKGGGCSEDCKFCSQSRHFQTEARRTPLKNSEEHFKEALYNSERGVHRFSVVTAGIRLAPKEIREIGEAYKKISSKLEIKCCGSLGLLSYEDLVYLKSCGLTRFHNNLETSRRFFPQICTTHSYDDKLNTLKNARRAGLELCSGCIIGMGETYADRIDLALDLRELGVVSTPINILNPLKGTPLEHREVPGEEEIERSIAIFRHILPHTVLRTAGGRLLIKDFYIKLFDFGINAEITGDMLTTKGLDIQSDKRDLEACGRSAQIIPAKVIPARPAEETAS